MMFLVDFLLKRKLKEIKLQKSQEKFNIIFSVLNKCPNTIDEIISDKKEQKKRER